MGTFKKKDFLLDNVTEPVETCRSSKITKISSVVLHVIWKKGLVDHVRYPRYQLAEHVKRLLYHLTEHLNHETLALDKQEPKTLSQG